MKSDKERDMLERQFQKMELNALYPEIRKVDITSPTILIEPKEYETLSKLDKNTMYGKTIMITHRPELVEQITQTGRDILKIMNGSEYGRSGTFVIDEVHIANMAWSNLFDTYCMNDVLLTVPLIPNRFDLMERAKADPKFECHQRIKAHTSNPTKRKASRLARKARRNNR